MKKEDLKEFGNVEICEQKGDTFHVKITTGFNINAMNTFLLMKKINSMIGDDFSIVEKLVSDENLFDYILKKKK